MDLDDAAAAANVVHALVVDDEPDIETLFRQRFRRELRSGKLTMQFANTGLAALEILEAQDPDVLVIFSDIEMPEMNGLELLERVRGKWPHVRIYLVTAYDSPAYMERAADRGAHGYLTKPLDFSVLRQVMFSIF